MLDKVNQILGNPTQKKTALIYLMLGHLIQWNIKAGFGNKKLKETETFNLTVPRT